MSSTGRFEAVKQKTVQKRLESCNGIGPWDSNHLGVASVRGDTSSNN